MGASIVLQVTSYNYQLTGLARTGASIPGIWFKYLIVTVNFEKRAPDRIRILEIFCFWGELKTGVPGESKYHDQEQTQAT